MKRIYLLVLCIIGLTLQLNAQSNPYEDVIYLHNGSIIRGFITEQVPSKYVKIEIREGNLFAYQVDEIEKITKELSPQKSRYTGNKGGVDNSLEPGYMGLIEFGYGIGVGDWAIDRISINVINGYRAVPQFAVGLPLHA